MAIASLIVRFRWVVIALWVVIAAALLPIALSVDISEDPNIQYVPEDTAYLTAARKLGLAFPTSEGMSQATLIFERHDRDLTRDDLGHIEFIANKIQKEPSHNVSSEELKEIFVQSPKSFAIPSILNIPLAHNPLLTRSMGAGQAGLVIVAIPSNFITVHSEKMVMRIRDILASNPGPDGLRVAVTGSSGFGHDYAQAAKASHFQSTVVTLIAVIIILLLVYRAPLAACVPLVAVALAACVVMMLLRLGELIGLHTGTAEQIFVFVLMFGAGIDYSMLLVSRYRENLQHGSESKQAITVALSSTFPAILASATTDSLGLFMLVFAQFRIFRSTGPAVAMALVIAMLAAVTLVPAMVAIIGKKLYWPVSNRLVRERGWFWPRVAKIVTVYKTRVLVITCSLLGIAAVRGWSVTWIYDTMSGFKANTSEPVGNAAVGVEMARKYWHAGEIAPTTILIESDKPLGLFRWGELAAEFDTKILTMDGVANVRSINQPLGKDLPPFSTFMLHTFGQEQIVKQYVSEDQKSMRIFVVLADEPLSLTAMEIVENIPPEISKAIASINDGETPTNLTFHIAGPTAETIELRNITTSDFHFLSILVLSVILITIYALLRDIVLSLFMIASTVLSYLATLGIAHWLLVSLFGMAGLDWKLQILLFVVMIAVGVDYNIFLAARIAQEARNHDKIKAIELAVASTGPVISSCGMIMAATLGSMMVGELRLLTQLGFALALGMIIDTFVVRPLLLPAFAALTKRTGKANALNH